MALVYDPESGTMITEYQLLMKQQAAEQAAQEAISSGAIEDLSGGIAPGVVESGQMSQEAFDKARGNPVKDAKGLSGPEMAMKSGSLALDATKTIIDMENQARQAKYLAEVAKYNAEQAKVDRATRVSQGLRV
jgi:hypothetical protein